MSERIPIDYQFGDSGAQKKIKIIAYFMCEGVTNTLGHVAPNPHIIAKKYGDIMNIHGEVFCSEHLIRVEQSLVKEVDV